MDHRAAAKDHRHVKIKSKCSYYIDQVRTNYGKFNVHFSGPSIWSNLDEEIKSLSLRFKKP